MMQAWLYFLPDQTDASAATPAVAWWLGHGQAQQGNLAEAAAAVGQCQVNLLLPLEASVYRQLTLTGTTRRWLRQSARSAIEDILADDIDDMHLATGVCHDAPQGGKRYGAIAIERQRLQSWLSACAAVGIDCRSVYIDADRLAQDAAGALLTHGRWLIGGAALPYRLALREDDIAALHGRLPPDLIWRSEGARPPFLAADAHWEGTGPWPQALAGNSCAIDLLQGPLRPTRRIGATWRAVTAVLALALTVLAGYDFYQIKTLRQHTADALNAAKAVYAQRYPQDAAAGADLGNLEQQFRARQSRLQTQQQRFAARLDTLAKRWAASDPNAVQLKRLIYDAQQGWTLEVSAPGFSELEKMRDGLRRNGVLVQTDAITRTGDSVSARLLIEEW